MSTLTSARSGLARSGATRSNYIFDVTPPPATADISISIGGILTGAGAAMRVLVASLAVHDALNETPNTCQFTVQGTRPAEGADVVITYGPITSSRRLFAGSIIRVTQVYVVDKPANVLYQVEAIDWSWELTHTLVSARYTSQSASAIGRDLLRFAPASFTAVIYDGLPMIDEISFTMTPLLQAYAQLAGRIGGYTQVDYFKRIRLYLTPDAAAFPPPATLTPTVRTFRDFVITRDFTQLITRALVEGGGVNAAGPVPPGETRLPVDDTAWYPAAGAWVTAGPQRIRYTGIVAAGGGAMASAVGGQTGNTAPAAGPIVGTQPGAGLPAGIYSYAYTWLTPTGECLPSPLVPFNTAAAGGPPTALTAGPVSGTGVGIGRYRYAFTWTTATGETVPSPIGEATTGQTTIAAPSYGPTPTPQTGAGLPDGTYRYAVTFTTSGGETTASPMNNATTSTATSSKTTAPPVTGVTLTVQAGPGLPPGAYKYGYTYVTANGETTGAAAVAVTVPAKVSDPTTAPTLGSTTSNPGKLTPNGIYTVGYAWSADSAGQYLTKVSTLATKAAGNNGYLTATVSSPPSGSTLWLVMSVAGQTALYRTRSFGSGGMANADISTMTDAQIAASPSISAATASTWAKGQVLVTGIATSPDALVTARRIYRSRVNASQLSLLTTLAGNTATSLAGPDTAADTALGANIPTTNTAVVVTTTYTQQVAVTAIPLGPAGVTGRKIYRTVKNGSTLALLATLNNNVATSLASPDTTPDASLGAAPPPTNTTTISTARIALSAIAAGPTGTTGRNLYRTVVNGTALKLLTALANNTTTTYTDATPDASLGAAAPTVGTAVLAQAMLTGITVGQSPTSKRRIYRTAVGGSGLKLLVELANNTATTYGPDTTPDASLGAAAPATDTSGLVSGSGGFVPAGSTSIPVASVGPFAPEGWALLGGVLIRYRSVSATALTGIPATGPGSLGFSVPFNTPIAVVAQLTGIPASGAGAIVLAIAMGDPVNVLAIADAPEAQALVAAAIGGTGIIEGYESDGRISYVEAVSRAGAMLDLNADVLETVRYRSWDPRTQSGAAITVALPAPTNVNGTYLIQDVTIGGFLGVPHAFPTYDVTASSRRFSFEDLIRRRRG